MGRKYQNNQRKRRKREKNKKVREEELRLSQIVKRKYSKEIEKFEQQFSAIDDCQVRLLKWKKWNLKGTYLMFKCPNSSCDSERAYVYKKKNHGKKVVRYQCIKCNDQFSLTSDTIFHKTRSPLWIWFLSIYSMALLDGKVPVTFLKERSQRYVDDNNLNKKVSKEQILRITENLKKDVFSKGCREIDQYLELVGFPRQYRYDSFLQWYDADRDNRHPWKTGWRTRAHTTKNNEIAKKIAADEELENVDLVLFCKEQVGIKENDWILCVRIKNEKLLHIKWLHVSFVKSLRPQKGPYEWQVIQLVKKENFERRPFKITRSFRKIFAGAVKKFGFEKFKEQSENNIAEPPPEVLEYVATRMRGGF